MTSQQSRYLRQSVDYLGFLSKQLGDLRGITSLAHELIQNADDAKDDDENLAATHISFDFRDDALIVSNNAAFRESDFEHIQDVASGTKRYEPGARTTGAFGVGFISVYQITDEPEIHSAGRRWTLRPDETEYQRIEELKDPSITEDKGTVIKLPWAFEDSAVRSKLKVSPVNRGSIDSFVVELKESLPKAILFLKKLDTIELRRNGKPVSRVEKPIVEGTERLIECDCSSRVWRVLEGSFEHAALGLRRRFTSQIESSRSSHVGVAIPDSPLEHGLLYATLPTKHSTGLPFHIDADFFPTSDRKSIAFEDVHDHRSEWNRTAILAVSSVVRDNLIPLRDMFRGDAQAFWSLLDRLRLTHETQSNEREPLGAIWKTLLPSLRNAPVVYTESKRWLTPAQVHITTGQEERAGLPAFGALGIEMVHQDLMRYQNILTSANNGVGVQTLRVENIHEALDRIGMVGQVLNDRPLRDDLLKSLWTGIQGILGNTHSTSAKQQAHELLRKCALASSIDGRLWPCGCVYRANDATRRIFANLVADDVSFLAVERIPLLERVCPQFTVNEAIEELERQDSQNIQSSWQNGEFRPRDLLHWFDDKKSSLTGDLHERLARLPIFPSAGKLRPLANLHLPGGFDDPIGVTVLVDMEQLNGLSDFLGSLGAKKLTFEDYATRYIPEAFYVGSTTSLKAKHKLLDILATRMGEIKKNAALRTNLSRTNIVECADDKFRQPINVYFQCKEVRALLGNIVYYVHSSEESEDRADLYRWLGVRGRPHPKDVQRRIDELAAKPPDPHNKKTMIELVEALGNEWAKLPDEEKELFGPLKLKEWLPAEGDHTKWFRPDHLYAIYNKHLFASQAKFLDASYGIQQQVSDFLKYLEVRLKPKPYLVVHQLLKCSREDKEPPGGIYDWLNDNAQPKDLCELRDSACLRVGDKYLRPDQVFWGAHQFGRFRFRLGPKFQLYPNLLQALAVRQSPDPDDAFEVLNDVSTEVGNSPLKYEDEDVVLKCWVLLSDALERGDIDSERIRVALQEIKCVPNTRKLLQLPSRMFFEDRPELVDKFPAVLGGNSIKRTERLWSAMNAAGVRPVSTVVRGSVDEPVCPQEDRMLKQRVIERTDLIKTIANDAIQLDSIRFIRADELEVKWHLEAFNRKWARPPEPASAHLDSDEAAIYFSSPRDNYPWPAISRELSQSLALGDKLSSISPGIKIILEADSRDDAISQLKDLGIAITGELREIESTGSVAESFEEAPPPAQPQEPPTPSQDGFKIGGVPDETQQVEQNEPAESDSTSVDSEEDAPPPAGSTRPASRADGAGNGGKRAANVTPPDEIAPEIERPTYGPTPAAADESEEPFAKKFFQVQTATPAAATESAMWITEGGPKTEESAQEHTRESTKVGRSGAHVRKSVTRWEPTEAAKELADKFRSMVESDYVKRCQICGTTFKMHNTDLQVFVVHVVEPSNDSRTNHFGDLLSLCGLHYAFVRYGEWTWLDPETKEPFGEWESMRDFVLAASWKIDDKGSCYVAVPVRFWNVYPDWRSNPEAIDDEIRYSKPHWTNLRQLLKT